VICITVFRHCAEPLCDRQSALRISDWPVCPRDRYPFMIGPRSGSFRCIKNAKCCYFDPTAELLDLEESAKSAGVKWPMPMV
jgi:hypothetical protein